MLPPSEARTPEAGHVGDVGGGHADHAGTGAAGDGQVRHLGDHGVGVGAGGQDGQGAVDFEPQLRHRPDGVMLLDFGDGDPCRPRLAASSRTAAARSAWPAAYWATCPCTCDSAWISRRVVWASHAASRSASVGSALPVCPARVRRACVLAAAGVLPGLLVQQPQRAPARRGAVAGFVLVGQPLEFPGDRDGAGAEQVDHVLADAADLGAVAVGAGHHHVAQSGQLCLHQPVGGGGDAEPLVVQRPGVQGAPFARRPRRRAGPGSRSPRGRAAAGLRRG